MVIGIPKETFPGERRVAIIPASVAALRKSGLEVMVETKAGMSAGYPDSSYIEKGAEIINDRAEIFSSADIILQIRGLGANPVEGKADLDLMREGQTLIAMLEPLSQPEKIEDLAIRKVSAFALELMPRITRAQSMDVLSSMANISGYKAALLAADALPRMFPMLMTAAGTIVAARVFVMGAGVAGLQAIATAHRLGAVVYAYDVRSAVKEQVQSLGAKFVEVDLDTDNAEGQSGYANEMGEDFYQKQQELMAKVIADSDVVITTAAIPGKTAPILITEDMVERMRPRSVIIDLAAENGGNCSLTRPERSIRKHGVTIIGPVNLASTVPYHASQMYAKNITSFLDLLVKEGEININLEDEIIRATLVTHDGDVVNSKIKELMVPVLY